MNNSGIRPLELRELLECDADTGRLVWKPRATKMFKSERARNAWNSKNAGKEAFTAKMKNGYRTGRIHDRQYYAHRVAFAILTGRWPEGDIDHVNGDRADNRACNLRQATRSQNNMNRVVDGTRQHENGRWSARIKVDGVERYLGRFDTRQDALSARKAAEADLFGEFSASASRAAA